MTAKNNHTGLKVGLGGAAAAAVVAAGAYYFFGKGGKKHRDAAMTWIDNAKGDLVAEIKKLKAVSRKSYYDTAARVIEKYQRFEQKHPKEFGILQKELKGHWSKIEKHLTKKPASRAKKSK